MKKSKLRDVADIQTGPFGSQLHKEDYVKVGTPIVTVEHLGNRLFTQQNLPRVSEFDKKRLQKYLLEEGDIVFSRVGSVDRCSYVDKDHVGWLFSGRCLRIRPSLSLEPLYLYYFLSLEETKKFIKSIAVGATMPSINTKILGDVEIPLPSIDVQKSISYQLSLIDRKIEVNNKINDNLQQQAEAAYSKLMDEAGNCTQVPLKDIAHITMGQSPAGHSCSENAAGTVFYQGRAEFGFRFPTRRLFTTEPKRMAKSGDVLLSVRAPVGDINVAYEECCIGRGLSAIESKTGESSFLLYTFRYFGRQFEVFNAEGTVFGSINKEQLNNFQIKLPPKEKIKEFEAIVRPMDDLIRMNFTENDRLTELREKLLLNFFNGK